MLVPSCILFLFRHCALGFVTELVIGQSIHDHIPTLVKLARYSYTFNVNFTSLQSGLLGSHIDTADARQNYGLRRVVAPCGLSLLPRRFSLLTLRGLDHSSSKHVLDICHASRTLEYSRRAECRQLIPPITQKRQMASSARINDQNYEEQKLPDFFSAGTLTPSKAADDGP